MSAVTGLVAVLLVFFAGPYRTMQKRWPAVWGRRSSSKAHANISLAATVAVVVHAVPDIGFSLTWVGTWLFFVVLLSGFQGMFWANKPQSRRAWAKRHRIITFGFYATILPHVVGQLLGWALPVAALAGWVIWRQRERVRDVLAGARWPMKPRRVTVG